MPDGGRITLTTRNCEPATVPKAADSRTAGFHIEFEVSDTGCGMDAATRARAFQPFFTTKKPGAGSGLGLATVSSIVQQSGGNVASRERTGKGARVVVRLPAQFAPAIKKPAASSARFQAPEPQIQRQGKQV